MDVVAHGSCLLALNHAEGQQLMDSNIGAFDITSESVGKHIRFIINARYKQPEACLRFANPPKQMAIELDGTPLTFKVDGQSILFNLPSAGQLIIEMKR